MERLLTVASLEEGNDQTGRERIACGGSVDRVHLWRRSARDLPAVLQEDRAVFPERQRDEAVLRADDVQLVPVRNDKLRLYREWPRWRGVYAEPLRLAARLLDRRIRNLERTEDRARRTRCIDRRICSGNDRDRVLAVRRDEDQRDAGGPIHLAQIEVELAQVHNRLVRKVVPADAAYEANVRAESTCGDGLVPSFPARDAFEGRRGDGLARPR